MKIAARIKLNTALYFITILVLGVIIISFSSLIYKAENDRAILDKITLNIKDLRTTTFDYFLYHEAEDRPAIQFMPIIDSLIAGIKSLRPASSDEKEILEWMIAETNNIRDIFSILMSAHEKFVGRHEGIKASEADIIAQLLGRVENIRTEASQLNKIIVKRQAFARNTAFGAIAIFILIMLSIVSYNNSFLRKMLLLPVKNLLDAMEVVSNGDMTQKTGIKPDNEIEIIAASFDRITEDLKNITSSRKELSKEIEERKRAEEELIKIRNDLERSNKELEQFAYIASHDLQEPLRMVTSYLQLLNQEYGKGLAPDAVEYMDFAVDGSKRMQAMINDLLSYSRIGTRGAPMELTDCNETLSFVIDNLKIAIEENGATIVHDHLPAVIADKAQLVSLFQNLISNAVKYRTDEPPRIHISARRGKGEWIFSVCDNGIGIDPRFKERIFQIFQRLHSRSKYTGTGIGLAVCNKIVERHGGKIWVESEIGKGSTFYFTIPDKEEIHGHKTN